MQPEPPSTVAQAAGLPGLTRGMAWYGVAVLLILQLLTDEVFGDPALLWRSLAVAAPGIAALAAVFALAGLKPYRECVAADRSGAELQPMSGG